MNKLIIASTIVAAFVVGANTDNIKTALHEINQADFCGWMVEKADTAERNHTNGYINGHQYEIALQGIEDMKAEYPQFTCK